MGVELATTGRFAACVFAAYGLTGTLPPRAVELLSATPVWIFHSRDDGKRLEGVIRCHQRKPNHAPRTTHHVVIFPVSCSDRLVAALRTAEAGGGAGRASDASGRRAGSEGGGESSFERIRYTRFDEDQEGFTGSVKGHSTGITASKSPEIYRWLLQAPPKERKKAAG